MYIIKPQYVFLIKHTLCLFKIGYFGNFFLELVTCNQNYYHADSFMINNIMLW